MKGTVTRSSERAPDDWQTVVGHVQKNLVVSHRIMSTSGWAE